MITPEQSAALNKAFVQLWDGIREWFDNVTKLMGEMFPVVSEMRRAEVKRVRTAYRRKKKGRW